MADFWSSIEGRRFREGTIPQIIKVMQDLTDELKRANDLKEEELTRPGAKKEQVQCRKCGEMRENWNANICKECWEESK